MTMRELEEENARLRAVISDLIGENDFSVIENNPDEGPHCFFCWGEADINGNVRHEEDCPVVTARQVV